MNWGKGIIIVFIVFAGILTTMVVISMKQEVGLVSPDYYKQEIAYQRQIDHINNFNNLEEKPSIIIDRIKSELVMKFPKSLMKSMESGEIQLFRPSQTDLDRKYALSLDDSGEQRIDVNRLIKGRWKVMLSWQTEKGYYNEKDISL